MKHGKNYLFKYVLLFQIYGQFWSVLLDNFIKHKPLISEEWKSHFFGSIQHSYFIQFSKILEGRDHSVLIKHIVMLLMFTTATVLCIRFDFSWCLPTDMAHNSWKVKIYHVTPINCGCDVHIRIIFRLEMTLDFRLWQKVFEVLQDFFDWKKWMIQIIHKVGIKVFLLKSIMLKYLMPKYQHMGESLI